MPPPAPFIVTAQLPLDIFAWADGLRRAHYPVHRNKLAAHVTLFHSFAPSLRAELRGVLARMAGDMRHRVLVSTGSCRLAAELLSRLKVPTCW